MNIESWLPLAVALVGSAGLGGILTGAIQLSRAARSVRNIEHLQKAKALSPEDGPSIRALEMAIRQEQALMAAYALVPGLKQFVSFLIVAALAGVAIGLLMPTIASPGSRIDSLPVAEPVFWLLLIAMVLYVLMFVVMLDTTIQMRRRRFVRDLLDLPRTTSMLVNAVRKDEQSHGEKPPRRLLSRSPRVR